MSNSLKKTLLISASLLMFLSVGTGINNINASKRHVRTSKIVKSHKQSKKHGLTKNQQIHKEHKYFYVSAHDVNSPEWYYKYSSAIDDYVDDNDAKVNGLNGRFYTNRAKSFMDGFNDNDDGPRPVTVRHALKKHHINPTAYKEGWVIGDNDSNKEYNKGVFTDSLRRYHLFKYGPTRKQHNKWTRDEKEAMSPTKREANSAKWFVTHYKKADRHFNVVDKSMDGYIKSYYQTANGKSYAIGFSDAGTYNKLPTNVQKLRHQHINPYSYKEGYILGNLESESSFDKYTTNVFKRAIHRYNINKPYQLN